MKRFSVFSFQFSVIALALLVGLSPALSQNRRKPVPASPAKSDASPPLLPIEARLGYHRLKDKAAFLTVRNTHPTLTIKKVIAAVMVTDPIKAEVLRTFVLQFGFAVPVKPKATGESVVTEQDDYILKGSEILPSKCTDYRASKDELVKFIPGKYVEGRDALIIMILGIEYTDGSKWSPASK